MAIIIEEERSGVGPFGLISWAVIILTIVVSVYYIFFIQPKTDIKSIPIDFQNTEKISGLSIDISRIINNPRFDGRTSFPVPQPSANIGRGNPFTPFAR